MLLAPSLAVCQGTPPALDAGESVTVQVHSAHRFTPDVDGTAYIWARSDDFDLALRAADESGTPLKEQAAEATRQPAVLQIAVEAGETIVVEIGAGQPEANGTATLHVDLAPSIESATDLAYDIGGLLTDVQILRSEGEHGGAREISRQALLLLEDSPHADESPELDGVAFRMAVRMFEYGEYSFSARAFRIALTFRERFLPPEHDLVLSARSNLGTALMQVGEWSEARAMLTGVAREYGRTRSADFEPLLTVQEVLAQLMRLQGDLEESQALLEQIIGHRLRSHSADVLSLHNVRNQLAVTLRESGQTTRARRLLEGILDAYRGLLDEENPLLQAARLNLAQVHLLQGDSAGALPMLERVLSTRERQLEPGDPGLLQTRNIVGATLLDLERLDDASRQFEEVVDRLPARHPVAIRALSNLAETRASSGRLEDALELAYQAADLLTEQESSAGHPERLLARHNLASILLRAGDPEGALEQLDELREAWEATIPADDVRTLELRRVRTRALARLDQVERLREETDQLLAALDQEIRSAWLLPSRETRERLRNWLSPIATLVEQTPTDAPLNRELLRLVETMRSTACGRPANLIDAQDGELRKMRKQVLYWRRRIDRLVQGVESSAEAPDRIDEIGRAVRERDRAERALRKQQALAGPRPPGFSVTNLAGRLGDGAAAVSYLVLTPTDVPLPVKQVVAWVVDGHDRVVRVELGPLPPIAAAVARWRAAVQSHGTARPAGRSDPISPLPGAGQDDPGRAGVDLRRMVLDPILEVASDIDTLHVCADGPLHLIPLNALPFQGAVVGDSIAIRIEVALDRLLEPGDPLPGADGMLVVGGVDFDAPSSEPTRFLDLEPDVPGTDEVELTFRFAPLPGTEQEVEDLSALYHDRFEADPIQLTGAAATKRGLLENLPGVRFLHIATHGFFAGDGPTVIQAGQHAPTIRQLAPLTSCGLALAGANRKSDALGRAAGILSGEELAGLDLRSCELAVLSACETRVGEQRTMEVQSLQAALHAAGVRASITTLWRVSDESSRSLMREFYRLCWVEGRTMAESLWQAKSLLREQGAPVRDWAGWILTGSHD